ncbi:hypothetical protein NKJ17_33400, partial [Mesorhizobium sp. M0208]
CDAPPDRHLPEREQEIRRSPLTDAQPSPSRAKIDREWPYQVALPDDLYTGHSFSLIRDFCEERGLVPITRQGRR